MESRLLLDVVITQGATILKLLSGENQTLLVGWDSLLVLDLGLDVVDGIGRFNLEGDGLSSDCSKHMLADVLDAYLMKGLMEAASGSEVAIPLAGGKRKGDHLRVLTKICMMMFL